LRTSDSPPRSHAGYGLFVRRNMNYYFFLPAPGLDCEIGLANFAPADSGHRHLVEQHVCSARAVDGVWLTDNHGTIKPGRLRAVRPSDIGLTHDDAASCLVFMSPQPVSGRMNTLPRPAGFECAPAWRANLRIIAASTSVSYQGEYPAGMFDIRQPGLVSICAMLQPGLINSLFLASFNGRAAQHEGSIQISRLKTGEVLAEAPAVWNRVNHIDLSAIDLPATPELVLLSSNDMAGIPIFFSRDVDASHLSLEHTHPPAELTVFGEPDARNRVIRKMRAAWLGLTRHA
jgi:hypothetical protein